MEEQINKEMAVFHQICEVNELDPKAILEEAQTRFPDNFKGSQGAERLIWTALDHRARVLISRVSKDTSTIQDNPSLYTIDGDPAAPGFVIHEDFIRSRYGADEAAIIIDALGQVHMPVTG